MLNGWKAIAAYLNREERTAMRWANDRGLPVHRAPGRGRGSVYALPAEIDAWLAAARRPPSSAISPASPPPASPPPVSSPSVSLAPVSLPPAPGDQAPAAGRPRVPRRAMAAVLAAAVLGAAVGAILLARRPASAVAAIPAIPAQRQADAAIADPGARDEYLKATYDWSLRTADSLQRAVREYGAVIARDPRAAAAYVGLANCYLLLREDGTMTDPDAYARAQAAAQAAIALDPDAASAHRALAFISFWWLRDDTAARREFARALAIDPADPLTHNWFANALSGNGEHGAALREIDRARELDPNSTAIVDSDGLLTYLAGRRAKGLAMLREVAREQPRLVGVHRSLADIALWEGRPAEYLRERAIAEGLRGDRPAQRATARIAAAGADPAAIAAAMLRDAAVAVAQHQPDAWFGLARVAAVWGRRAQADDALSHACRAGEPATVAAAGDLWLSRSLDQARIRSLCGGASLQ